MPHEGIPHIPTEFPKLPPFPTLFTPEDEERLRKIEEQRRQLEKVFQTKFTPEAWAKLPLPERAMREFLPPWLTPVAKVVTPEEFGVDFGFTPAQAQEKRLELEEEYKELLRKQRITRILPLVKETLRALAFTKDVITDATELRSIFKLGEMGFSEDEIGYVTGLAQRLLTASPEELASGEVFEMKPLSPEDIDELARSAVEPRFINTTIALSKRLEDVTAALQEMYAPQVEEPTGRNKIIQDYVDRLRASGVSKESSKELFEKIAEEEGELLILTDEQTGAMIPAVKRPDGTVWFEGDLLGFYSEGKIVPIDIGSGKPLLTEESQESALKDLWDSFYLGAAQAWHGTKQALFSIVPQALLSYFKKWEEISPFEGTAEYNVKMADEMIGTLQANQALREAEYQEWLKEHPDLIPRPEYTQSPIEHPELFADPYFYAHTIISNAPIIGAALITGIVTTLATKNPWAGAIAGAAIITPTQINSVYEDLIASGADPSNAAELATGVGTLMGAVEILPGMIVLRATSPIFMRLFKLNFQKELTKQVVTRLSVKRVLGTFSKIELAETLEEVTQQAMQNAAVKTVDENRSIVENIPETFVTTLIAVAPLALFGGGAEYVNMRAQLPKKTQDEIDTTAKKMEDAGLSKDHAEAAAFAKVVETEKGQAEVEEAVKKVDEKVVPPDKVIRETERLTKKLESLNSDIDTFGSSVIAQEARYAKMKMAGELPSALLSQRGLTDDLMVTIKELEESKAVVLKKLKKMKKAKVALAVPEVTEAPEPTPGEVLALWARNLALWRTNRQFERQFIDEGIRPAFFRKYGDVPIMEIQGQFPTTTHPLLAVSTAGWRERVEALGFKFVRKGAFEDLYEIPFEPPSLLIEQLTLEAPTPTPVVEEVVSPEPIPEQLVTPDPDAGRELMPDGRPRIQDWDDEQESIKTGLEANPSVFKVIQGMRLASKTVREARGEAERTFEELHTSLDAAEDEETRKGIEDQFKALAKETGLTKKTLLAKHWNDMTPPEQQSLTLAAIEDGALHLPVTKEVYDMRYYMQFLQEESGLPFYNIFKRAETSHGAARLAGEDLLKRIGEDPMLKKVRSDKKSLARVTQHINAKNPRLNVPDVEDLTTEELLLTNAVEDILTHYEPHIRYLRVVETDSDMDSLKTEFPDAVEAGKEVELALALELKKKGDLDGLWSFLGGVDWGTIVGYTPWMKGKASLFPPIIRLGTTRGAARLMRRDTIEFDKTLGENLLLDVAKYVKQIESQWRLKPEMTAFEEVWKKVSPKFDNKGQIEGVMREWSGELQGIPTRQSLFDSILRRVWRQAMSAVFLHPWMAFRNFHQAIAFHPDRTELFRLIADKGSPAMQEKGRIYFDSFVSQLKGIRREWLYMGEKGLPGLGWLTRLSDSMSLYSHSDNIPRWWSFRASLNKAMRATERYEASSKTEQDVKRWLKVSGAVHLRETERAHALQLLVQDKFDLAVPGLKEVTGGEMASMYIGHEIANMTHFIYERAFRAPVELGATGRTLYNLIVFPRGYWQRVYLQGKKLPNLKEIFSQETDWEQARAGFKDIVLLMIVGTMISEWLRKVTGRPRRAYNPADIVQWQLGGLVIGVGMDLTKLISDIVVALDPTVEEDYKNDVLSRLPGELVRQIDVLVPFYRTLLDSIEASTDTKNIDVQMLRKLRALLDKDYTPEEIEKIDRKLWEKFRKAVLAGEPPDPSVLEVIQTSLIEAQTRLGEMDAAGRFYTLRQFGGEIKTLTKPLPDDMLTEQYNFSDLVIFYKESEDNWKEIYKLPSSPANIRQDWRKEHIEAEAMLLFWGMYSQSVFRLGTPEWEEVAKLLQVWFDLHGIDKRMHKEWSDWTVPTGA